jgi:hypothetical protein
MPFHCHPGQILLKDMCHRLISYQHCNSINPNIFVGSCTGSSLFHLRIWWLGIINQYGSFHFIWTVHIIAIDKMGKSKHNKTFVVFWLTHFINCDTVITHNGDEAPKDSTYYVVQKTGTLFLSATDTRSLE